MANSSSVVPREQVGRGGDEGEVHDHVGLGVEPWDGLGEEVALLVSVGGLLEGELGDDDPLVGPAAVGLTDVVLELAKVGAVPCIIRREILRSRTKR